MAKSNYDITRDRMEQEFLSYNQGRMVEKYALNHDRDYLYLTLLSRDYRISRTSGRVEWSRDGFRTAEHAGFDDSMTIFDVLCYGKGGGLSGRFISMEHLPGAVRTTSIERGLFQAAAERFTHRAEVLARACEVLGGRRETVGDVAYRIPLFPFLPLILQFWDADEEFDSVVKILWDENVLDYLHYETAFYAVSHLWRRLEELMEADQGRARPPVP